jgi:hypothetical protein
VCYDRFKIRRNLDDYYRALQQLLQITAGDYLDAMLDSASIQKVAEEFSDSLPELMELYDRAIESRDILDQLRQTRLVISNLRGRVIERPRFFKSVLGDANWGAFLSDLRRMQQQLKRRLVA